MLQKAGGFHPLVNVQSHTMSTVTNAWNNVQRMRQGTALKARIVAIAIAAAFAAPAGAQLFAPGSLIQVQAPQKGQGRPGPAPDRGAERRGPPPDQRPQPQPDRRGQMTDDERRSLNQDLDKANRELYRRRPQ